MADLTVPQQADIRADLAIAAEDQTVFTDINFNRLFVRAGEDYNTTVKLALWQLLMDTAKFNDYTAGQTRERKDQIFTHMKSLYNLWEKNVVDSAKQVKMVGSIGVPARVKDKPGGSR